MKRVPALALLSLVLLPLVWLWPCVFGDRTFVPYDINQFAPASITATDSELQQARDGANYDVTEVPVWFVPELELARDELRAGRWPTWNPHARSGAPLHAHGLIGLGYPPNWLALFADEPASRLGLVAWCNLALAGLLAFGLFRQLGLSLLGAWLGAMLFQLSSPMAANSFFWMRLASFVWLPGVLWAMLHIAKAQRATPLAILGLAGCFAMTWLAGFPPFAATATFFAGLLFVWLAAERLLTHGRDHALRLCIRLFIGLALGACWALPQVLPSLAFFPDSARPPTPLWTDITGQAFEPYGLLCYLMPSAFGDPTMVGTLPYGNSPMQLLLNTRVLDSGKAALPNFNFTEYSVFISSFGIVLALIGLLFAKRRRAWFARLALLVALGLGLFWPGLQLLFHLPVVQNVWPMRWPAAATLFVVWLAALGFEHLLQAQRRTSLWAGLGCVLLAIAMWWASAWPAAKHAKDPEWAINTLVQHYDTDRLGVVNHVLEVPPVPYDRFAKGFERFADAGQEGALWLLGVGVLLLAFASLRSAKARHTILLATVALSAAQLSLHGATFTRGTINLKGRDTQAHTYLRDQADARASAGGFMIVRTASTPNLPSQLPPGQLMHRGIRDLNFYSHADARTLEPVRLLIERYHERLGLTADDGQRIAGKGYLTQSLPAALLRHPLFDLFGVRYALTTESGLELAPYLTGPVVGPELRGRGQFFIHERINALPRAYTVRSLVPLADDQAVLAAITDEALSPKEQAYVVRADLPTDVLADLATTPDDGEDRAVTFARDDPTNIELDVAAGSARYLVLADTFLPGWQATIDGEAAEVIRCNHCQRLVVLPERACRVTFRYHAPGLTMGLILAMLGTLSILATWWFVRRRGDRCQQPGPMGAQAQAQPRQATK